MKRMIAILICSAVATQTVALADDDNPSACGAVLCLAGLIADGSAGGDCNNYMTGYFSIVKFRHGHFDETGTSNARSDFTNQCQSAGPDTKKGVNDRYGNVQSGP
ncbi:TrbM/KikA/MpfK family conjugal transfer protein (plasmid) [Paraburkholderia sp. FT54]|uniref:TrbM/KikA/MpfK family conjugal transfer protein n=1 Tax=Paraburkholderia sp. FT54 TaxID=3074437 RepID=UPI002877A124|nr:TrbM/KikA/MpfK family conjugal transfer protein [Paraburkholderia sp. FT54]WNC95458.1 TrbM/KikA/MpfK family conjugal transfer protein [Paraburkholderia sp. FT54]